VGDYAEEYWVRLKSMDIDPGDLPWQELAVRFSAYAPGVGSAIVGTGNLSHFLANVEFARMGPLSSELTERILKAYDRENQGWLGQV
jgi:aryl-alcohol dehydrogenase-like predicted oxidoreductase